MNVEFEKQWLDKLKKLVTKKVYISKVNHMQQWKQTKQK